MRRAMLILLTLHLALATDVVFELVSPPRLPTQKRLIAQGVEVDALNNVVIQDLCLEDYYLSEDQCLPCDCGDMELVWELGTVQESFF
jgi:hypothetical protein